MGATTNAKPRREREGYYEKYFKGRGVDFGGGSDPITKDCLVYDLSVSPSMNAQRPDLPKESFDWVFSSHCLEHLPDPEVAFENWWDLVRPQGYLVVSVPHYILYEHRNFPSLFNHDHKATFSMFGRGYGHHTRHPHFVLSDLARNLEGCQIISYRLCDANYNYLNTTAYDRTYSDRAEAEIEIICRKQQRIWLEEA
jgi:SAM-dependent methyltransferase